MKENPGSRALLFPVALFSAMLVLSNGCLFNPDEPEPAYLAVDELSFTTTTLQGTSSHAITEIWVYANDNIVGVYDLPARIPVLETGPTSLSFYAGIKNNGIASTRIKYPFYTPFDTTLNLQPLSQHTIKPRFRYESNVDFHVIDFNNNTNPFYTEPTSDVDLQHTNVPAQVFEGNGSAYMALSGSNDYMLVRTDEHFTWKAGDVVFAEMNFSNNNTFAVGVVAYNSASTNRSFALIFNPGSPPPGQPQWKKIYVDLGFAIGQHANADYFEFYIECNRQSEVSTAELFLDNIKLLRFN